MFPPKPLDIFSPEGGYSEGLDAFRFFLNCCKVPGSTVLIVLLSCNAMSGTAEPLLCREKGEMHVQVADSFYRTKTRSKKKCLEKESEKESPMIHYGPPHDKEL